VELSSRDQVVLFPEWIGQEVTDDARFYNSMLSKNPYSRWRDTV
jgi:adenylate cyclase